MGFLDENGYAVGQHYPTPGGDRWAFDLLALPRMVRIYGRDANAEWLVCDATAVPSEPDSRGFRADAAVWYASGNPDPDLQTRPFALWANAYPALIDRPSGTQGQDPYRSKVKSSAFATPAFRQDPSDPASWQRDTGVLSQKVAVAGGEELPAGTPVIVLPFSITSEQQMAAFKASGELVAVWKGGRPNGPLGTLVYDVDQKGALDRLRRSRDQSSWRVYRLPFPETLSQTVKDSLPFGGLSRAQAEKSPFPVSSGLAWQLGLDVDGQAGYGMIVANRVKTTASPPSDQEGFLSNPAGNLGQTQVGTFSPSSGGAPDALLGAAGAAQGVGGGAGTVITNPLAADPGMATSADPTTRERLPQAALGGAPGTVAKPGFGLPMESVFGVTSAQGYGPLSVGPPGDVHQIAATGDGEPIVSTHLSLNAPMDGDGFDAPVQTDGVWEPDGKGGPLRVAVFFRYDASKTHPHVTGDKPGRRRWQVPSVFDVPSPREKTGQSDKTGGTDKSGGNDKTGSTDKAEADKFGSGDKTNSSDKTGGRDKTFSSDKTGGVDKIRRDKTGGNDGGITDGKTSAASDAGFVPKLYDASDKAIFPGRDRAKPRDRTATGGQTPNDADQQARQFILSHPIPGVGPNAVAALVSTFGGGTLLEAGDASTVGSVLPASASSIRYDRTYARTPLEVAAPALLARSAPVYGLDLRGRGVSLSPEQQAVYDSPTPISGALTAFASQAGGGYQWFAAADPGAALYQGGVANAGGFVFHPANIDPFSVMRGEPQPGSSPTTSLNFFKTQAAWGTPLAGGLVGTGYALRLSSDGSQLLADTLASDGSVTATSTVLPASAGSSPWQRVGTLISPNVATDSVQTGTGGFTVPGGGATVTGGLSVLTAGVSISAGGLTVLAGGASITGGATVATGNLSVTNGTISCAQGVANSEAFGASAGNSGTGATSVGHGADANTNGVAVGYNSFSSATKCTAVGEGATASASGASAIGGGATASASGSIAVGDPTTCGGASSIVIGTGGLITSAARAIAIGASSGAGTDSIAIGYLALAPEGAGAQQNVVIGRGASVTSTVGFNNNSVAIGYVSATDDHAVGVGSLATAGTGGVALGYNTFALGGVAIGRDAFCDDATHASLGSDTFPITSVFFGKGYGTVADYPTGGVAAPVAVTLKNTDAIGADVAGADFVVEPSLATGLAASGHFRVAIGQVGASGSTPQTSSTVLDVDPTGVTITGKLTVTGGIDPTHLLLTGDDKRFGATDAGAIYLAPFADQVAAVEIRKADDETSVVSVDTTNGRVGIGTSTPGAALDVAGDVRCNQITAPNVDALTRRFNALVLYLSGLGISIPAEILQGALA